jgi:hypothetical protein
MALNDSSPQVRNKAEEILLQLEEATPAQAPGQSAQGQ